MPNVNVEELLLDHSDLNTKRMMDLMAVNMGEMPLYLHVVQRVLRDMRIEQQQKGTVFAYADFKARIAAEGLSPAQCAPLHQRLDTLESFMPKSQTHVPKGSGKTTVLSGTNWAHRVCRPILVPFFLNKLTTSFRLDSSPSWTCLVRASPQKWPARSSASACRFSCSKTVVPVGL